MHYLNKIAKSTSMLHQQVTSRDTHLEQQVPVPYLLSTTQTFQKDKEADRSTWKDNGSDATLSQPYQHQ